VAIGYLNVCSACVRPGEADPVLVIDPDGLRPRPVTFELLQRREIGPLPGAAANLVGLAYIAAAQDRHDDAMALLDEAGAIAKASNAQRIMQQINQARAKLSDQVGERPA
jgi:hypothetical protein